MSNLSGNNTYTRFSINAASQFEASNIKMYSCSNCNQHYDVYYRNNTYIGKVPLILNCKHTMCEECIRSGLAKGGIVCNDCGQASAIIADNKLKLQNMFPINFYLLGVITSCKPNVNESSKLKLQPAGVSYTKHTKSQYGSSVSLYDSLLQEQCCKVTCKQLATLRCTDCDEVYCESCCHILHQSARGLKKHKIISSTNVMPELNNKCSVHKDNSLDFFCNTCEKVLCCYCIALAHNGHSHIQLSDVNVFERSKFDALIESAGEKLKRLIFAHKRVQDELTVKGNVQTSEVDLTIGRYFANLHAKLQCLENRLKTETDELRNKNLNLLKEIDHDLSSNIRTLNGLIINAKSLFNPNNDAKFNVKLIVERLENALNLPCYFVGESHNTDNVGFIREDPFNNVEELFTVNFNENTNQYRLVDEDGVPDNYETDLPRDLSLFDVSNLTQVSQKSTDSIPSLSSLKSVPCSQSSHTGRNFKFSPKPNIDGWIRSVHDVTTTSSNDMPKFRTDDRENVIVSHIDTPESFYVQLIRFDKALDNLCLEIQELVRNFTPVVKNPELNKLYVVKYTPKNSSSRWYRGRLVDISTKTGTETVVYTVLFIDYGNQITFTSLESMREIGSVLAQPKPFAQQCKLFDLYPITPTWDSKAALHMAQVITGGITSRNMCSQFEEGSTSTKLVMVIMDNNNGILEVDLLSITSEETASIRDALIFVGLAIPHCSSTDSQCSTRTKSGKAVAKLHTRTANYHNGDEFSVFISCVVSPQAIYVQVADFMHHVDHLNNVMTSNYNKKGGQGKSFGSVRGENIYVPKKNMVVAVNLNNTWYRGTIIKVVKGEGTVTVFLVDYGTEVTVNYTHIRRLPERYRSLECQAILVKLAHIKPRSEDHCWDSRIIDFLNEYIDNKTRLRLVIVSNEKIPFVAFFEPCGTMETCINNTLINEGLAASTSETYQLMKYHKNNTNKLQKEDSYVGDLLNTIQCSKKTHIDDSSESEDEHVIRKPVNVLFSKSPDEIYVEVVDPVLNKVHLELHVKLQEHYSKEKKEIRKWKMNDPCVVFNSKNYQFFRGIIEEEVGELFKVMLRDVAQEIIVPADAIFVIHEQFKQYLEKAVRCHLASVIPAGDRSKWSCLSIEYLQDIFDKHRNILMTKSGPVDRKRKSVPVIMWYSEIKPGGALEPSKTILCNINKLLVKNGLAFKPKVEDVKDVSDETPNTMLANESKVNSFDSKATTTSIDLKKRSTKVLNNLEIEQNTAYLRNYVDENNLNQLMQPTFIENNEQFFTPISITKGEEHMKPFRRRSTDLSVNNLHSAEKRLSVSNNNSPSHVSDESKNLKQKEVTDWNDIIDREISANKVTNIVIDTETSDWLPPRPFKSKNFSAIATFVDDAANIYLYEDHLEPVLKQMEEEMKNYFSKTPPEPFGTVWDPGQLCTVKYFVNDSWYRGKIVSVSEDSIKVFLIDYGNVEDCKHDDLRFRVMYLNLPAFAKKVHLFQVFPKTGTKWLTSDLDELHKMLVENKIDVTLKKSVKSGEPIPAIIKLQKVNINQYMRDYSTNLVTSPMCDSSSEDARDDEDSDVIIEDEQSDAPFSSSEEERPLVVESYPLHPLPESLVGQKINVTVTSIFKFNQLILEILYDCNIEETRKLFQIISQDIHNKGEKQPQLIDLQVGQACIGKFSEDGEWYRGEILNLDDLDKGMVQVGFVDFGNAENVPKESVKTVHPDWLTLPVLQYKVLINDIQLRDPSCLDLVLECMSEYCNTIKLAEIISVNPLVVKLYDDNDELAYQDLIDQNLLLKID